MSATPVIIDRDDTAGCNRHRYYYTRVAETGGRVVRAHVTRDSYLEQCTATVAVLADDMTWTHLAAEDPNRWVHDTPHPPPVIHAATELGPLVEHLLRRAAEILAPTTTGTPAHTSR